MEKNFATLPGVVKSAKSITDADPAALTKLMTVVGLVMITISPAVAQLPQTPSRQYGRTFIPGQVPTQQNNYNPANIYNPYSRTSGFYTPPYLGVNYPAFGAPRAIGGSYYQVPSGQSMLPMWHAPSGYYYPWAFRPRNFVYAYPLPILVIQNQNPEPALPPLSVVFSDMTKYLDENKKDKKISEYDYTGMIRRVKDLQSKERTLRIAAGGTLDPADEAQIRRDLDLVGSELSWRVSRESK